MPTQTAIIATLTYTNQGDCPTCFGHGLITVSHWTGNPEKETEKSCPDCEGGDEDAEANHADAENDARKCGDYD